MPAISSLDGTGGTPATPDATAGTPVVPDDGVGGMAAAAEDEAAGSTNPFGSLMTAPTPSGGVAKRRLLASNAASSPVIRLKSDVVHGVRTVFVSSSDDVPQQYSLSIS